MPEYRIPYSQIPWLILLATLVEKSYHSFFYRPYKWVKDAKYYRKRRVRLQLALFLFLVFCVCAAAQYFTKLITGISLRSEIWMCILEILS